MALRSRSLWLTALTFLSVCGSILLVGAVVVPILIDRMEDRYLAIQSDLNARQARSLAQFAELRLAEGQTAEAVRDELQAYLSGADADLGYSCVIHRETTEFVCHPMSGAVGMGIAGKEAAFSKSFRATSRVPWEQAIGEGAAGIGSLQYPDGKLEIVHLEKLSSLPWTVTTHENTAKVQAELAGLRRSLLIGAGVVGFLLALPSSLAARAVSRRHERQVEAERARSERLLLNILPESIAERLKMDETQLIADRYPMVTVLFADLVGFTPLAADTDAQTLVGVLNQIFSEYDDLCEARGLEKIKTIGDAYLLCGGLSMDPAEAARAAVEVAEVGREMVQRLNRLTQEVGFPTLELRVGIHSGELVAGVIGKRKFTYDIWGDVVNTAARLESSGLPGRVQLSQATADLLGEAIPLESRGMVSLKGIGETSTWLLPEG